MTKILYDYTKWAAWNIAGFTAIYFAFFEHSVAAMNLVVFWIWFIVGGTAFVFVTCSCKPELTKSLADSKVNLQLDFFLDMIITGFLAAMGRWGLATVYVIAALIGYGMRAEAKKKCKSQ